MAYFERVQAVRNGIEDSVVATLNSPALRGRGCHGRSTGSRRVMRMRPTGLRIVDVVIILDVVTFTPRALALRCHSMHMSLSMRLCASDAVRLTALLPLLACAPAPPRCQHVAATTPAVRTQMGKRRALNLMIIGHHIQGATTDKHPSAACLLGAAPAREAVASGTAEHMC
jgi:hypothetical protein